MDSSQDDEDIRTLGLPPGALVKILHQDGEKGKPKDRERPAAGSSGKPTTEKPGAWSQPPSRKPPSSLAPAPPTREPVDDAGSDFRTLTPAGFGRNRREIPGLDVLRENQGLPPPPMVPSTKPNAPQDRQAPGPAQGRPPIHTGWPDADTGRSLQSDKWPEPEGFETALLPHQKKPARAEVPPSQTRGTDFIPPDPWAAPSSAPPPQVRSPSPAMKSPPAETDTSNPVRYPGAREASPAPQVKPTGRRQASPPPPIEREGMTVAIDRPVRSLKRAVLTLQFYNVDLHRWSDLGEVRPEGQVIGRSTFTDWDPNPESLAEEHLRLAFEGDELLVEPLPSLNGAYLKLMAHQPVELEPHARFRVGRHVLEYRPGEPPRSMTLMCSEEGEVFQSRVLTPRGFVDLIGLDQQPYLTFPLTKADEEPKADELPKADERGTRIGREGLGCDIALSGDDWASAHHARIVYAGEKCLLEDLKSTNGTFLMISQPTLLRRGSLQKPDTCDVVLIGSYLIRVIEERV